MSGWDLLDDEPDQAKGTPSAMSPGGPAAESAGPTWDSVDEEPPPDGYGGTTSPWTDLDDSPGAPGPVALPPELAAAQLKNGQVLWARVDGQAVTLGSGQQLHVPDGVPDGIGGWRRVRITDASSLRAEVLEFQLEVPAQDVADDPALAFPSDPVWPPPQRPEGFPVGQGGALTAAFETKVRDARQEYLRKAKNAEAEYQRRVRQSEQVARRDYDQRVLRIQQEAAAQQQEAIQRIHASAAQQVQEARAAQEQAERERDAAREALAMARQELDKSWWRRLGRGGSTREA